MSCLKRFPDKATPSKAQAVPRLRDQIAQTELNPEPESPASQVAESNTFPDPTNRKQHNYQYQR